MARKRPFSFSVNGMITFILRKQPCSSWRGDVMSDRGLRTELALALGEHSLLALLQQRLLPQRLLLVPLRHQRQ